MAPTAVACKTKELDLSLTTHVWCKEVLGRSRLDKLLTALPAVSEVWRYKSLQQGTVPKALVRVNGDKRAWLQSMSEEADLIHNAVVMSLTSTSCSALWIVKARGNQLQPNGLALVTNKQLILPAKGELILS